MWLCHQHAYVSSAALPALPLLLEVVDNAGDQLSIEILDILTGMAVCSRDAVREREDWMYELRAQLLAERERFTKLTTHSNKEVATWGVRVLDALGSTPRSAHAE